MFRFKSVRRSRSLTREPGPGGRRPRKPPASDDHDAVPDDSFAPMEPWDQHSSRTFQPRQGGAASAAKKSSGGADPDGEVAPAPTLETFLTGGGGAAFDASHVKTVGMDEDDDAASRGAYSTISTMIQAKRRRHKRSLRQAGAAGSDAAAGDATGSPDALNAFLSRNQETAAPYDEAGDEQSRGAHTTMTGVVRGSRHRGLFGGSSDDAEGRRSHDAAAKDPNPSKDAKGDLSQTENDQTASASSKSKSRAHSHRGTSVHRSSSTAQLRRTSRTQRSELQQERNEEHVTREKSSRRDGLTKSDSYKDMGRNSSSLRDPVRRSISKRSITSAKEQKTIASHLAEDEKHARRHHGRSSATVSGAPLTRNHSKEYLDAQMNHGESRPRRHKERHDSVKADSRKHHTHATIIKNAIDENEERSLEIKGSSHRLKSQSRSSGRASSGNVQSVEKEFWNLLSTLKRPSNGSDQKNLTSDLPKDITVHTVDSTDGRKHNHASLRKSSMHSHSSQSVRQYHHHSRQRSLSPPKDNAEKASHRHSKNGKHHDGSSSHLYDDKLRPSTLPDAATTVQLDEYGMIKIPSSQPTKSKESKDRVHREKSSRTIESSRRYTMEDEKEKSNRNSSPSRASKPSRRNSSKYTDDERTKPSRHRSHSTNRHSSTNEYSEKRSSRRSSKTGEDKDPERKHRRHRSSRVERDSETDDRERRRGRERKRLDASSRHKSSEKSEKKSSHRSMSVQPSSHGHHKHRSRAHSLTPRQHHDDTIETYESVAKTKEHFRSLLKSGSSEEKLGGEAAISVPNKMLSIKGRFNGDEDNALPRVEDKTPVSPGASVGEISATVSDGEAPGLHDKNNHAVEINAKEDGRAYIDLTDSLASPVPHIDLVDGVIVAQEKMAVDDHPTAGEVIDLDDHVNRLLAQPSLDDEKTTVDGSLGKNAPIETTNTGLWGMFRSRMKPSGASEEANGEMQAANLPANDKDYSASTKSNNFSDSHYENDDEMLKAKTLTIGEENVVSHATADAASDMKIGAASHSMRSMNGSSPIGSQSGSPLPAETSTDAGSSSESTGISAAKTSYPESRFLSAPYAVNSSKSIGKPTSEVKSSEVASLQNLNNDSRQIPLSSTRLVSSLEPSDKSNLNRASIAATPLAGNEIRKNVASLPVVPTSKGKADTRISPSGASIVKAENVPYNEEDVFALFLWSSHHQEERKVIAEREKLRGVLKCTPLGQVLERVKPY